MQKKLKRLVVVKCKGKDLVATLTKAWKELEERRAQHVDSSR